MLRDGWSVIVTWRTETADQLHRFSTPSLEEHQIEPEDLETVA